MSVIRVQIPYHLRTLARVDGDLEIEVAQPATVRTLLDAIEAAYPTLKGTIREYITGNRRPWIRFFACREDWSFESHDKALPEPIVRGEEPFMIVGAIAGG